MATREPNIVYPVIDSYIAKHHTEQLAYEEAKRDIEECIAAAVTLDEMQIESRAHSNVRSLQEHYRMDVAIVNDVLTDDGQVFEMIYCKAYKKHYSDFQEIINKKEGN